MANSIDNPDTRHNRPMLTATAFVTMAMAQKAGDWTRASLESALKHGISHEQEVSLRAWFGNPDRLRNGADAKIDDLAVAWAIDAPGAKQAEVVSQEQVPWRFKLKRIGKDGLFVGVAHLEETRAFVWRYEVDGKPVGEARQIEVYTMPPESKPDPSIPAGKLEALPKIESKILGGTRHDGWVYTTPGLDPSKESNLIVFQDGQWYKNYVPTYLDHLTAQRQIGQTVAVFVSPGTFPDGKSDRSREYDTLSDLFSRFILEEVLPQVETRLKLSPDPMRRCSAGLSSGGICAFTCAWQRPDKFGLVLTWIGSFTNIASGANLQSGGHNYPALIRKTPKKPIRIWLQDGDNDLDNEHGNWPLANRSMISSLEFAKYDLKWVWGHGFHSDRHGRVTLADALRWLFKG